MKAWKRKYQAEYMALDSKPKGKLKRAIEGSVRADAKKEIRKQTEEYLKEGKCHKRRL